MCSTSQGYISSDSLESLFVFSLFIYKVTSWRNPQYVMPNIANISFKWYFGGLDFDRSKVDKELAKHEGKERNVLIDSLGGSLATGLSISVAFKKHHGKVNVHFVGLSTSVANIASLGKTHIFYANGDMCLDRKYALDVSSFVTILTTYHKINISSSF